MSRASQIILLCEDHAHEVFASRFLTRGWGIKPRSIRVVPYPKDGKGSGKKWVEDNLEKEGRACRKRAAQTILLIVQDADELSVDDAKKKLEEKVPGGRGKEERIAFIIPKWSIETWLAYLDGKTAVIKENDRHSYRNAYKDISNKKDVHPFIDKLAEQCKEHKPLKSPPKSLESACDEFDRIRPVLQSS